jgi:hypothetical protein
MVGEISVLILFTILWGLKLAGILPPEGWDQ